MNRQELLDSLFNLPHQILAAENVILTAQDHVITAKDGLNAKEAELYAEGKIDGKNAEIRSAQIRQLTIPERNEIAKAENELAQARINYNWLQNTFSAHRTIAGMLKAGE